MEFDKESVLVVLSPISLTKIFGIRKNDERWRGVTMAGILVLEIKAIL